LYNTMKTKDSNLIRTFLGSAMRLIYFFIISLIYDRTSVIRSVDSIGVMLIVAVNEDGTLI